VPTKKTRSICKSNADADAAQRSTKRLAVGAENGPLFQVLYMSIANAAFIQGTAPSILLFHVVMENVFCESSSAVLCRSVNSLRAPQLPHGQNDILGSYSGSNSLRSPHARGQRAAPGPPRTALADRFRGFQRGPRDMHLARDHLPHCHQGR